MASLAAPAASMPVAPAAHMIDTGDRAWIVMSSGPGSSVGDGRAWSSLVLLFYGGLARSKQGCPRDGHALSCYPLCREHRADRLRLEPGRRSGGGWLSRGVEWLALSLSGADPPPASGPTIPHHVFMVFQHMCAAVTGALMMGACAERMTFSAMRLFRLLWSVIISCRWPAGDGVAGGWARWAEWIVPGKAVRHISSGISACACALVLGQRKG